MIRIGIVGCGTIGSALAKAIEKKFPHVARLSYISDHHPEQLKNLQRHIKGKVSSVPTEQLIDKSDFIIEAASVSASAALIPKILKAGKSILVLSVGGILKVKALSALLKVSTGSLYVPSGAIAGIDGILAHRIGVIKKVEITTRKPLKSLRNAVFFKKVNRNPDLIKKPTLIFEGTASKAIEHFPENVNVAVTLSLAGIGPTKTKVKIFTSPAYKYNVHEIAVTGSFGNLVTRVTNLPSKDNPKTSALAIGSAIATLEKIFSRFKVGT